MFIAKGNFNEEEVIIQSTDGTNWEIVEDDDENV